MDKELIIFDMDGTLIDSSQVIAGAINYVRSKLSLPQMERSEIIRAVNDHSIRPAQHFYQTDHFEPAHEEWFSHYYTLNHRRELSLYSGIDELLKMLRARGRTLAVATNAYRVSALESLEHVGISGCFDSIVCYDDVPRGKPYPDMLEKILSDLGLESSRALMVGDGERDMMAAKSVGMDYVMVNWGFSDHGEALGSVAELRTRLLG